MEDRKRPALSAVDDLAPPSKRQAVNGTSKSKDDGDSKEEAWIEEYQKGAIFRQMLEYKRQTATLEKRLEDMEKKSAYYDDHVRILDSWWTQLLQEIEVLVDGTISTAAATPDLTFPSSLHFQDSKDFQKHLGDKGKAIKTKLDNLFSRLASSRGPVKSDVAGLEAQLKAALARQKEFILEAGRLKSENESLSDQYNEATFRYVKAEKKLDRVKSAQVQRLEQQAIANATMRPADAPDQNGDGDKTANGHNEALQSKYEEVQAVVNRQQEQIESLLAEIKGLQDENSTFKVRKESVSDEDYARTDVFKQFKSQNEDLIKRINTLEATNKQLREEAQKLQAERTEFRDQLQREAQALTVELEDQIQLKETDLTRIRSARDELFAELTMRKASQDQEQTAIKHIKELVAAKDDRLTALELELERLRPADGAAMEISREDLDNLSLEDLRQRYLKLEKDFATINQELSPLQSAYTKAQGLAHKKVMDQAAMEERVAILTAEKAKADQKYFAARKDMDVRTAEIRALRLQNSRSSEIISQQKDEEAKARGLLTNLEKQLADLRQSNSSLVNENKKIEGLSSDANRRADSVKAQISDLTNQVRSKDAANSVIREKALMCETELDKMRVRLEHTTKDRDTWKAKSLSNSSTEEEMLRQLALCSVCRSNFKNSVLKTCGHVFCNECIESRIQNRMRKCPTCNKAFDKVDVMAAHL